MNRIISDTAEYGCYLFNHKCLPLLSEYVKNLSSGFIGEPIRTTETFDNGTLENLDKISANHPIEKIGKILRRNMSAMKKLK